jgi:DNA-3-methyladenine glycosylase I
MMEYHDNEWGTPVHDDDKHFEFLILDAFQAGLSWSTILNKRENFRKAFDKFDAKKISKYDDKKIAQLLDNAGIIRNKLKIHSTINNATLYLELQEEIGSFDKYVWSFVGGKTLINKRKTMADVPATTPESDALSKDMKKRGFKFVGSTILYAYMQAAGLVNDHIVNCFRYKEVLGK